jgi:hypothetical protein
MTSDPFIEVGGRTVGVQDAIRNAVTDIMQIPQGHTSITSLVFTYNVDKLVETLRAYENSTLLFTLTFAYNADKKVTSIVRS